MNQSVTIFGGSVVDLIFEIPKHYLLRHGAGNVLTLPFGAKLASKDYALAVGGSGANVAAGLAKLGLDTTLWSALAADPLANFIRQTLKKADVKLLDSTSQHQTAVSVVLRLGGDRTIITGSSASSEIANLSLPESGWLHIGPLPEKVDGFLQKVISQRIETNQGLSINPSMIQIEERSRTFVTLLKTVDVVFLNLQEALRLTRLPANTQITDILRSLQALGVKVSCITDGERGAYVGTTNHIWYAAALCDVVCRVDATGAGDAFASGFLGGFINPNESGSDDDICEQSLKMAMLNSAAVVEAIGAQTGLKSRTEIERDLGTVKIKIIR